MWRRYIEDLPISELQNIPGYNQRTWFHLEGATPEIYNTSLPRAREISPGKLSFRRGATTKSSIKPIGLILTMLSPTKSVRLRENF